MDHRQTGCTHKSLHFHSNQTVMETTIVTVVMVCLFVFAKHNYDKLRRSQAQLTLVVIGGGPIGLLSALIATRTSHVSKVVIYEEKNRRKIVNRQHQLTFNASSISFLKENGVDFNHIEGCWDGQKQREHFYTRIGVFEEYLLSILTLTGIPVDIQLGVKFTKHHEKSLHSLKGRKLVIVCDGANGQTMKLFGIEDDYHQQSCSVYGAVATIEKSDERQIPAPEICMNSLTFDLSSSYGKDLTSPGCDANSNSDPPFHLKIFGSYRNRYMSLIVPKCQSKLVKTLRTTLDRSIMRNIFKECFNHYKSLAESKISDIYVLNHLKFTPRLFDVKAFSRVNPVAYIEDTDTVVSTEGDSSRFFNLHTGIGINLSIPSLSTLEDFICQCTVAQSREDVYAALLYKHESNSLIDKKMVDFLDDAMLYHRLKLQPET